MVAVQTNSSFSAPIDSFTLPANSFAEKVNGTVLESDVEMFGQEADSRGKNSALLGLSEKVDHIITGLQLDSTQKSLPRSINSDDGEVDLEEWMIVQPSKDSVDGGGQNLEAPINLQDISEEEEWVRLSENDISFAQSRHISLLKAEASYDCPDIAAHFVPTLSESLFPDSAAISFKNGKLVPETSGTVLCNTWKILHLLLAESYGADLAWRTMNRYQLVKKEPITFGDVKKALLGISVNVLVSDLKALFDNLKSGKEESAFRCRLRLSSREIDDLRRCNGFSSLSVVEIGLLLKAFQTLDSEGDATSMFDRLYQGKSLGLPIWQFDCFAHDTEVAKRLSYIHSADRSNLKLSISEHISKNVAYLELKPGMIVPMLTESAEHIYYYVAGKLQDKKDGVICSLLAPLPCSQKNYTKEDPLTVHLNFRGTQWQPDRKDSYESLQRDLDYAGIGKSSFELRSEEIAEMLFSFIKSVPAQWVKIVINGHSLGGTDAQRALRLVVDRIRRGPESAEMQKITAVEVFCHNSPAPEEGLNEQFTDSFRELKKQGRLLPISITLVLFETDPLQNAGDLYIGAGMKEPLLAKSAVFAKSKQWKYFGAHRLKAFVGPLDPCDLSFVDSSSPDDILEKVFSRNFYLAEKDGGWAQAAGRSLQWYGGYAVRPLKDTLNGSLYFSFSFIRSVVRSLSAQRSEEPRYKGWGGSKVIVLHPSNY